MKLLCIFALTVCAFGHGANVPSEILPSGVEDVTKHLERSQYDLHLVSQNFDEINDVSPEFQANDVEPLTETRLITDAIKDIAEEFRDIIINGNDDIPPLDPLVIPVMGPYDYDTFVASASATINNLRMEGLRWFVLDRVIVNALRLRFGMTLTVPWITTTGSYDARARLGPLIHRAGGNFRIFANRIDISLDMRMGTNILNGHLVLRELDIHIDIHDTQITISGMTGSSIINSFISATIQNLSQEFIQNELAQLSVLLSEELFDTINDVLKEYTVSDIFG